MSTLTITPIYYDQVYERWMREFCLKDQRGNLDIQMSATLPARFKGTGAVIVRNPQPEAWRVK